MHCIWRDQGLGKCSLGVYIKLFGFSVVRNSDGIRTSAARDLDFEKNLSGSKRCEWNSLRMPASQQQTSCTFDTIGCELTTQWIIFRAFRFYEPLSGKEAETFCQTLSTAQLLQWPVICLAGHMWLWMFYRRIYWDFIFFLMSPNFQNFHWHFTFSLIFWLEIDIF